MIQDVVSSMPYIHVYTHTNANIGATTKNIFCRNKTYCSRHFMSSSSMFANVLDITVYILIVNITCPIAFMLEGIDDVHPGTRKRE